MNRIHRLFARKRTGVLSVYLTAGYPSIDHTLLLAEAAQSSGADMIEIGIPFSDPVADGPVIQRCHSIALANGMTMKRLFLQLTRLRERITIPVVLMGYFNPIFQYGIDRFVEDCANYGVDGFIVPDWPPEEFEPFAETVRAKHLSPIFLVTSQTDAERIRRIDRLSDGFLYAVSSFGTTGQAAVTDATFVFLQHLRSLQLRNPVMVGFGFRTPDDIDRVRPYCAGTIVGSAFLQSISESHPVGSASRFIRSLRRTA